MVRRVVAVAAMLVVAAAVMPMQPMARAGAVPTQLTFTVWTFAIDTIQDNINRFQSRVPNVAVKLADYNWGQYNDTIVANFVGGSSVPDVLYSSDHWLQQWAAAGWIAPLDDYFPQAKELAKSFAPYAVEGMTYKGKLYGVPYYADPMAFMYNAAILRQAGFGAPPQTWAEVLEQAKASKLRGWCNIRSALGSPWRSHFPSRRSSQWCTRRAGTCSTKISTRCSTGPAAPRCRSLTGSGRRSGRV